MQLKNIAKGSLLIGLLWCTNVFANHIDPSSLVVTPNCKDYVVDLVIADVPAPGTITPEETVVAVDYTIHLSNGKDITDTIPLDTFPRNADGQIVVHATKIWNPSLEGAGDLTITGEFSIRQQNGYVVVPPVSIAAPISLSCKAVTPPPPPPVKPPCVHKPIFCPPIIKSFLPPCLHRFF